MFADVMAVLFESCLRASLVLCAAWALTLGMRRASASARHFVWSCAIAGALLAPAMSGIGPRWNVSLPSPFTSARAAVTPIGYTGVLESDDASSPTPTLAESKALTAPAPPTPAGRTWLDVTFIVVLLWAAGALGVVLYAVSGVIGGWWIRRSATSLNAPWVDEAHALAEAFEIRGPIAVVESALVTMPMVCGVWRPQIVMPQSAAQWSDARCRVVVLHELAHIKRRDCLTQIVAQMVCAAYWFNPIVWLAARRLRSERERACDDFVLTAGERGTDYAAHLLDIARAMRHRRVPAFVGLAMARPSQLEGRLLAILDPALRRSSTLATHLMLAGLVLLITLPVGAVELTEPVEATRTGQLAATIEATPSPAAAQAPRPTPTPTPAPRPERRQARAEAVNGVDAARIGAEIGHVLGTALGHELGDTIGREIPAALAGQANATAAAGTVEALIGALSDADPDVREMVVVTLARIRDPRIVPALLPLLKDANADVREQAVFALARSGDARATAAITTMVDDASPDVREQAVHMLGRSRNRDAVPVLVKALNDSSADVREQAAFALGQLRDVSAIDPLLALLKDSSPDVREQSVFALGQLRNGRAVDGLIAALGDSSPDVREQAAFALGQIRDPKALASLTAALRDSEADVREQAAFAIGQISGQQ
jgi:HEAT repeat protein/beta-lactamase regulating signal transducer with metallopeptidase domain